MTREALERRQVWSYLAAISGGLALGLAAPAVGAALEALLWPVLALLLYATFTQVRLDQLPEAFRDRRFMGAALFGNFAVLPILAYAVMLLTPADPAIRLGLLMVLLVPCTDWFITFTHQAGGDVRRAVAVTPVLLLTQMLLLPVYLWLFLGDAFMEVMSAGRVLTAFGVVIAAPLALAWLTERWAKRRGSGERLVERMGWAPVPLLAGVLFIIAASQAQTVMGALPVLGGVAGAFIVFLTGAVVTGLLAAKAFRLPAPQARTLLFSFSTRNSFVVLPFALALPIGWEAAAIVIVLQSMVELFGMLGLLWLAPRLSPGRG